LAALILLLATPHLWATVMIKGPTKPVRANGSTVTLTIQFTDEAGPSAMISVGGTGIPEGMISNLSGDGSIVMISKKGTGTGRVRLTVSKNESSLIRGATLSVNGAPFSLIQAGQPCKVRVAPPRTSFECNGGAGSFDIHAPAGCPWNVTETLNWVSVRTPTGTGNGTVSYDVLENSGAQRRGRILVTGIDSAKNVPSSKRTYRVTQKGVKHDEDLTEVTLAWDQNTEADLAGYKIHHGATSGQYDKHIDVGNVTQYTVTGLQAGMQYFAATAYNTSGIESAFSNEISTNTCTYSISPTSAHFGVAGGTGEVRVTAPTGCAWTAGDALPMKIISGGSGSGNGTVTYYLPPNTSGSSLMAATLIAGNIFGVTQGSVVVLPF
jgi:hypothetical protein